LSREAPTKIRLLALRRALQIAESVHEILENKREVLLAQLNLLIDSANEARRDLERYLLKAYESLAVAVLRIGEQKVEEIAITTPALIEVEPLKKLIMGLVTVTLKEKEGLALPTVRYGVEGTTVALDESIKALRDSINYILKLSELETTIYRLVDELKNTQRLINALEYIIIPRYRKELEFIESVLEELAREEFARQKIYKRRRERGD